ncbi:hypothetical protein Tco_0201279 [Tanacetum coccineum]
MVRALMYLTTSRPDIVHATCYCARYQAKPTEKHLTGLSGSFSTLKIPLTWDSRSDKLVNWSSKKQDCTLVSLAEAEYVSLSACALNSNGLKGIVELFFVRTEYQLADLFTNALSEDRFKYLVKRLGLDDDVAASFQRSRIHKPHAHTQAFKVKKECNKHEHVGQEYKMIANIKSEINSSQGDEQD